MEDSILKLPLLLTLLRTKQAQLTVCCFFAALFFLNVFLSLNWSSSISIKMK